jgi:hypothetical protein
MRRAIAIVVQCCILAQALGCTRALSVPVNDQLPASRPDFTEEPGARISGYVTADGVSHTFDGWAKLEGDEFLFQPAAKKRRGEAMGSPGAPFRLPRREVVSFVERETNVGKSILAGIGIVAAVSLIFFTIEVHEDGFE